MAESFNEVLTQAVRDLTENGYDDEARLQRWMYKLRYAANYDLPSAEEMENRIAQSLRTVYRRTIDGGALKYHPALPRFTLTHIAPQLRIELDRKILASSNLIKLNREQAIDRTLQRFSGWATSIPAGGSKVVDKVEIKTNITKSLKQVKFELRRLDIDQGHKLVSAINSVIAQQSGAIAGMWHSRWQRAGYNYRVEHKDRDQKVYAIRNSWAVEQGLINKGAGYTDEMTAPGEEVFCSCYVVYYTSLRELPDEMLTAKGREWLKQKSRESNAVYADSAPDEKWITVNGARVLVEGGKVVAGAGGHLNGKALTKPDYRAQGAKLTHENAVKYSQSHSSQLPANPKDIKEMKRTIGKHLTTVHGNDNPVVNKATGEKMAFTMRGLDSSLTKNSRNEVLRSLYPALPELFEKAIPADPHYEANTKPEKKVGIAGYRNYLAHAHIDGKKYLIRIGVDEASPREDGSSPRNGAYYFHKIEAVEEGQ